MSSHAITNEVTGTGMVRRMGVKVMTEAQVERLRDVARAIIRDDFGGNQTATARHLGIAQSQFSGFINGTAGASLAIVVAIADHTGRGTDDLLGRPPPRAATPGQMRIGSHADWARVRDEAVAHARKGIDRADVELVADVSIPPRKHLDYTDVLRLAEALAYPESAARR